IFGEAPRKHPLIRIVPLHIREQKETGPGRQHPIANPKQCGRVSRGRFRPEAPKSALFFRFKEAHGFPPFKPQSTLTTAVLGYFSSSKSSAVSIRTFLN